MCTTSSMCMCPVTNIVYWTGQEYPVLNRAKASKVVLPYMLHLLMLFCLCFFVFCFCFACHIACYADVDECSDPSLNTCDITQDCINTIGSYTCVCKDGYTFNGQICEGMIWSKMHCFGHHMFFLTELFKILIWAVEMNLMSLTILVTKSCFSLLLQEWRTFVNINFT